MCFGNFLNIHWDSVINVISTVVIAIFTGLLWRIQNNRSKVESPKVQYRILESKSAQYLKFQIWNNSATPVTIIDYRYKLIGPNNQIKEHTITAQTMTIVNGQEKPCFIRLPITIKAFEGITLYFEFGKNGSDLVDFRIFPEIAKNWEAYSLNNWDPLRREIVKDYVKKMDFSIQLNNLQVDEWIKIDLTDNSIHTLVNR